jgi:hypothetical protein
MKSNSLIWIVVAIMVWTALALVLETGTGHSQEKTPVQSTPTPTDAHSIFGKVGVVDYDAVESLEGSELERRKRASARYDNEEWVMKNPHPDDVKVARISETEPPPVLPIQESDVIVVGKITAAYTRLSNDKTGIYTEFSIDVVDSLRSSRSTDFKAGITIDRAGGIVRYPNGQLVLYEDKRKGLPDLGKEYILFLKADQKSGNYQTITLYELSAKATIPLDSGRKFDEIERMGKAAFLRTIRDELARRGRGRQDRFDE